MHSLVYADETTISVLDRLEFACHSAACAPPPHGTGGSLPGGSGKADQWFGKFGYGERYTNEFDFVGMTSVAPPMSLTFDESNKIASRILNGVKESGVRISIDPQAVRSLILSERFKTVHETGASSGAVDADGRHQYEKWMFGRDGQNKKDAPVYGFVPIDGQTGPGYMYGRVVVRLKPSMNERTTISIGDTAGGSRPIPIDILPGASPLEVGGAVATPSIARRLAVDAPMSFGDYVEAQVHGGVTTSDIAEVFWDPTPSMGRTDPIAEDRARELAEALGVPVSSLVPTSMVQASAALEFACHDESCAPPPVGTGGSSPSSGASAGAGAGAGVAGVDATDKLIGIPDWKDFDPGRRNEKVAEIAKLIVEDPEFDKLLVDSEKRAHDDWSFDVLQFYYSTDSFSESVEAKYGVPFSDDPLVPVMVGYLHRWSKAQTSRTDEEFSSLNSAWESTAVGRKVMDASAIAEVFARMGGPEGMTRKQIIAEAIAFSAMGAWESWAGGSNHRLAYALHQAAAKEFGLGNDYPNGMIEETSVSSSTVRAVRVALRAQYNLTQSNFRAEGIGPDNTVKVYRGMLVPTEISDKYFGTVALESNPLSSWTSEISVTRDFYDSWGTPTRRSVLVEASVPTRDILSLGAWGIGNLREAEVLMIGRPIEKAYGYDPESDLGPTAEESFSFSVLSEFACHDASCAPPPYGTGGSLPDGGNGGPGFRPSPEENTTLLLDTDGGSWSDEAVEREFRNYVEVGKLMAGDLGFQDLLSRGEDWAITPRVGGSEWREELDLAVPVAINLPVGFGKIGQVAVPRLFSDFMVEALSVSGFSDFGPKLFESRNERNQVSAAKIAESMGMTEAQFIGASLARKISHDWKYWIGDTAKRHSISNAVQQRVSNDFGVGIRHAPWDAYKFDPITNTAVSSFIRAQYTRTQNVLRSKGIEGGDKVRIYRGINVSKTDIADSLRSATSIDSNPLSSWSLDEDVADDFASLPSGAGWGFGFIVDADIPARDIFGLGNYGFGTKIESEVVVIGRRIEGMTVTEMPIQTFGAAEFGAISEFACHDAACAPPPYGSGGSLPGGESGGESVMNKSATPEETREELHGIFEQFRKDARASNLNVPEYLKDRVLSKIVGSVGVGKILASDPNFREWVDTAEETPELRSVLFDGQYEELAGKVSYSPRDLGLLDALASGWNGQGRSGNPEGPIDSTSLDEIAKSSGLTKYEVIGTALGERLNNAQMHWCGGSGDLLSYAVQHAIGREFPGGVMQDYVLSGPKYGRDPAPITDPNVQNVVGMMVKARYQRTQQVLKDELGISGSIRLYRGMSVPDHRLDEYESATHVDHNPSSSWTVRRDEAIGWGNVQYRIEIPVEKVYSISSDGHGCLNENEVVVIGHRTELVTNRNTPSEEFNVLSEFACHDASCAPPPVGTGGSKPGGESGGESSSAIENSQILGTGSDWASDVTPLLFIETSIETGRLMAEDPAFQALFTEEGAWDVDRDFVMDRHQPIEIDRREYVRTYYIDGEEVEFAVARFLKPFLARGRAADDTGHHEKVRSLVKYRDKAGFVSTANVAKAFGISEAQLVGTALAHKFSDDWEHWVGDELGITFSSNLLHQQVRSEFGVGVSHARWEDHKFSPKFEVAASAFVKARYKQTQEFFKDKGVPANGTVRLYRGINIPKIVASEMGSTASVDSNPLSSWTFSKGVAVMFAGTPTLEGGWQTGVVLQVDVPVKDIFSIGPAGFGSMPEKEAVVIGRRLDGVKIIEQPSSQEFSVTSEFACHSAECAPPPYGSGGSLPGGSVQSGSSSEANKEKVRKHIEGSGVSTAFRGVIEVGKLMAEDPEFLKVLEDDVLWESYSDSSIVRDEFLSEIGFVPYEWWTGTEDYRLPRVLYYLTDDLVRNFPSYRVRIDAWKDDPNKSLTSLAGVFDLSEIQFRSTVIAWQFKNAFEGWWGINNPQDHLVRALNRAAKKEFGTANDAVDDTFEYEFDPKTMTAATAFLRGQYKLTQDTLRGMGINEKDKIKLYRGLKVSEGVAERYKKASSVDSNPLSSWTAQREIASSFTSSIGSSFSNPHPVGLFLSASVPAENVISLATLGLGNISEFEAVVIGRRLTVDEMILSEGL